MNRHPYNVPARVPARVLASVLIETPVKLLLLCLCLSLTVACEIDTGMAWQPVDGGGTSGCPAWECGTNGPMVNDLLVGEFNITGAPGEDGYRIFLVTDALGVPLTLDVVDGIIEGKPLVGATRTGAAMIGARIILEDLSDLSLHAIVIDDFDHVPSWTDPSFQVPAYHFWSAHVNITTLDILPPYQEVCQSTAVAQGLGLFSEHYAVVVDGERYDPFTKTVSATGQDAEDWFNLACNGSALSKMKLMGYDPAFTDDGTTRATTTAQREATLKMITGAYCPSGLSFTVSGEPLRWSNRDGTVSPFGGLPAEDTPEAIFTENGALCLDVPRRANEETDILDAIEDECGAPLPSCAAYMSEWQDHGEWRTGNPIAE